jgi:glycosyltransferase involved in cell wall biosynthesis
MVPRLAAHPKVTGLLVGVPETLDFSTWQKDNPSVQWVHLRCGLFTRGREIGVKTQRKIEEFEPDVLFIPTGCFWSFKKVPVVNMVRNMEPFIQYPSRYFFTYKIRNWARLRANYRLIRKASRIIVVSKFVRNYLTNHLVINDNRIGIVYHGTDLFRCDPLMQKPSNVPKKWQGNFIFTAGLIYPYRGLEDIILALPHLDNSLNSPILVIAGKIGQGMKRYYHGLKKLIERSKLTSKIRWLGVLKEAEMNWCYRNCSTFVVTSRVEACPNIVLEAMAHGCISVSTDNPPMSELFGNVALYYPAGKADLLAQQICKVLKWPNEKREALKKHALARASKFSWDLCCQRTVGELEKAIEQNRFKSNFDARSERL